LLLRLPRSGYWRRAAPLCASGPMGPAERLAARIRHGCPDHLLEALGAGGQHRQPVEAEGDAGGGRHAREGGEEVLVDRITLAMHACLLVHLRLEAAALLRRVDQLAEAVGELDAADIQLETLGDTRIVGRRAGEGGL